MASQAKHVEQADRNFQCSEALANLNPVRFTDWEVTTLFYSALHYVEAYLAGSGIDYPHPKKHSQRKDELANRSALDSIALNDRSLHDYSENARYELAMYSEAEVAMLRDDEFVPIRDEILSLLGARVNCAT